MDTVRAPLAESLSIRIEDFSFSGPALYRPRVLDRLAAGWIRVPGESEDDVVSGRLAVSLPIIIAKFLEVLNLLRS